MSKFARRIDQLDGIFLDEELLSLLLVHYRRSLQYFPNSFIAEFGPELDVLFKFLYKYLPLYFLGSTFGQNLFHLQYRNSKHFSAISKREIGILAFASACLPWFWERIMQKYLLKAPDFYFGVNLIDASYNAENKFHIVYKTLNLLNFLIFLQKASYPSLIERFLKIRPLYSAQQDLNSVMDENLYRELLWYGLSEFISFTLPLINIYKIKGFCKRSFLTRSYKAMQKKYTYNIYNECAICGNTPNFPHTIGCSHVFCYYCIASMVLADSLYSCFDCDVKANGLESIKPLTSN